MLNKYYIAFQRLVKELDPISSRYKTPKFIFLIDAAYCYLRHGASPHDYVNFQFYKIKNIERKKFLTMRRADKVEKIFNDPNYADYFNNKYLFNKTFKDFVKRKWIYAPEKSDEEIIEFIKGIDKVIIKPIGLSSGKGIYTLTTNDISNLKQLCDDVKNNKCMIEEYIQQHPAISKLNPRTVNTVRMYSIIDNSGTCNLIYAALRVGGKNADVDNFHNGGVGYPIDLKTGVIAKQGVDLIGNEHIYHPSSGVFMLGYQIPNWDELQSFVLDAAKLFPKSRYIAWDVAVLENGFEMVEGNYMGDPGFLQALDKVGKRDIFIRMA